MVNSTADQSLTPWARLGRRRIAPVAAVAAVMALTISVAIGGAGAAANAGAAVAGTPALASAVPKYYVALPGGDNFGNVPGSATAVVGDTITGKRLLTVRPSGQDKFVSVSAAADDTTFVLGGNPDPEASLPTVAPPTDWYLVQLKPGSKLSATVDLRRAIAGDRLHLFRRDHEGLGVSRRPDADREQQGQRPDLRQQARLEEAAA